jgi:hypothetical protein
VCEVLVEWDVLVLVTRGGWVAVMEAMIVTVAFVNITSRLSIVQVAAKLEVANDLDEIERQVFGGVEVIQDLVVCGTEGRIRRSLEGSHSISQDASIISDAEVACKVTKSQSLTRLVQRGIGPGFVLTELGGPGVQDPSFFLARCRRSAAEAPERTGNVAQSRHAVRPSVSWRWRTGSLYFGSTAQACEPLIRVRVQGSLLHVGCYPTV